MSTSSLMKYLILYYIQEYVHIIVLIRIYAEN
jgi:hypothetical protein